MEEIRVYHSFWKQMPLLLTCIMFAAIPVYAYYKGDFRLWMIFPFLFFGGGALLVLWGMYVERKRNRPYLTITDKAIFINKAVLRGNRWLIERPFKEIDHFELAPFNFFHPFSRKLFIYHKSEATKISPSGYGLPKIYDVDVSTINMSPKQLCILLNERIKNSNR